MTGARGRHFLFTPERAASSQALLCSHQRGAASGNQSVKIKPREIHDDKAEAEKQKHQRFNALLPSNYANAMLISIKSTCAWLQFSLRVEFTWKNLVFCPRCSHEEDTCPALPVQQCIYTPGAGVFYPVKRREPVMMHLYSINKL